MPADATAIEQHYTISQAADLLQVHKVTVMRLVARGSQSRGVAGLYPVYRLGKRATRIPARAIARYLEAHRA
jgi:hypothetical protein